MSIASTCLRPWIAVAIALSVLASEAQQRASQAGQLGPMMPDDSAVGFDRGITIEISVTSVSNENPTARPPSRLDRPGRSQQSNHPEEEHDQTESTGRHQAASTALPTMPGLAALLKAKYGVDIPSSGLRRWDSISFLASARGSAEDDETPVLIFSTTEHLTFWHNGLEWHISIRRARSSEDDASYDDLSPDRLASTTVALDAASSGRARLRQSRAYGAVPRWERRRGR